MVLNFVLKVNEKASNIKRTLNIKWSIFMLPVILKSTLPPFQGFGLCSHFSCEIGCLWSPFWQQPPPGTANWHPSWELPYLNEPLLLNFVKQPASAPLWPKDEKHFRQLYCFRTGQIIHGQRISCLNLIS